MTITNELPAWVPIVNLIVRLMILSVSMALVISAHRTVGANRLLMILASWTSFSMSIILVAGSLNQVGILQTPGWIMFGTGGSIVALILILTLFVSRRDL